MSTPVSKAQKLRLGIFLIVAGTALVGTLVAMIGATAFEQRDDYRVLFQGSVSGLERGAQVQYNGIRVGRVESLRIAEVCSTGGDCIDNPDGPGKICEKQPACPKGVECEKGICVGGVEAVLSLQHGTPVKSDSTAILNLKGITGLKYIELTAGSSTTEDLEPGGLIPSAGSDFDLLAQKLPQIANQIEGILNNIQELTSGENAARITSILGEVEGTLSAVRKLLEENHANIAGILANFNSASAELDSILVESRETIVEARATLTSTRNTVDRIGRWVDPRQVKRVLTSVEGIIADAQKNIGPTLTAITNLAQKSEAFVEHADLLLLRARDDVLVALSELVIGAENFSEFTAILRDNPAAIISGRSDEERALP